MGGQFLVLASAPHPFFPKFRYNVFPRRKTTQNRRKTWGNTHLRKKGNKVYIINLYY